MYASEADKAVKSERLEARITAEQKVLLQRAADLEGRTLTDFVVSHAQTAALETIEKFQIIQLSQRDSEIFVASLLNPPEPGAVLKAAAARYKSNMERV